MITSESINEIAAALAKAQAQIQSAEKDSRNPHYNSRYSSLASVWDACRVPLSSNGLSVCQGLSNDDNKIKCTTILLHSSGQFIKSELSMTPQQGTPQSAGSCATYLRRYSLQAIVGVAPDDDDGNAASQVGVATPASIPHVPARTITVERAAQPMQAAVVESKTANSASQVPATSSQAKKSGYDPHDKNHQDHMMKALTSKNVPGHLWDDIGFAMKGKPFTDLDSVIKKAIDSEPQGVPAKEEPPVVASKPSKKEKAEAVFKSALEHL